MIILNKTCYKGRQYQFAPLRHERTKVSWKKLLHRIQIIQTICHSRKTFKFSSGPNKGLFMNTRPADLIASLTASFVKKLPCTSSIGARETRARLLNLSSSLPAYSAGFFIISIPKHLDAFVKAAIIMQTWPTPLPRSTKVFPSISHSSEHKIITKEY